MARDLNKLKEIQCGKITRKTFSRINEVKDMPYLVEVQSKSFKEFVFNGIREVFDDFSPVIDHADHFELYFLDYNFGLDKKGRDLLESAKLFDKRACDLVKNDSTDFRHINFDDAKELLDEEDKPFKYSEKECKERDATLSLPMRVKVRLVNKVTGESIDSEVFMGDIPWMTKNGSFIINGAERAIVSQLVRSPGIYVDSEVDKSGNNLFDITVIPNRGAWLEFKQDSQNVLWVNVDRTRKLPATVLLRALGFGTDEALMELFGENEIIASTIDKDSSKSEYDGLNELYRRLRPGEMPSAEAVRQHFKSIFFDPRKYDVAGVGRYKYNKRLRLGVRIKGLTAFTDVITSDGEILVKAGEEFTEESAEAVQNAGINAVLVNIGGKPHKIIGNNVVDFKAVTGKNPKDYELLDYVYYPVFELGKQIADYAETNSVEDTAEYFRKQINEFFYIDEKPTDADSEKLEDKKSDEKKRETRNKFVLACKTFYAILGSEEPFDMTAEVRREIRPLVLKLNHNHITADDIVASVSVNLDAVASLRLGKEHIIGHVDNIDHLGNRRVRSVGELLQNQFRIGIARLERVIKERMSTQDAKEVTPSSLINVRPVSAAIKEFFGSSQLSQFMDQNNPIAELTHKRKLSALGPGGLNRERATFEVRDVNYTHYGRICPIETPEGQNIGLISSLTAYAKVNEFGFIETPYRKVVHEEVDGKIITTVTDDVRYMTADEEDAYIVAQANEPLDENNHFVSDRVSCRHREDITVMSASDMDYMDVSPKQLISVATALIPFLENDDTNRALMGSNMQRQAVPLLMPENAIVATGIESKISYDSGVMVTAKADGIAKSVAGDEIVIEEENGFERHYKLKKFERSNQGTCINQRPIVSTGDKVKTGDVIADGPATSNGELALGRNILIGFMTWEGYNYEDAILLSEKLVRDDVFTSIHIEEHETEARDTKLGPEEITRDIPNVGEDALKDLDADGIIRIGAKVTSGDILVGKVTPKGEAELTPEERLLRAIFGEKAREVRDTSLKVPHGEGGIVVDVKIFTRANKDELQPGVNKLVRVYIAQKRKISIGDKMAGRHGNKGVISRILPEADMPFLADGTPLQIVLNPLGVPSRMNIGQVLEVHLGNVCKQLGWKIATPVFDGADESEIKRLLQDNNILNPKGEVDGKIQLYDGRTGEPFENRTTVGQMYMIKLHHLVDDKIHARSTGPYSLVTQQPLGGKAQFGGQRFGEMEVWALEAYGAAHILQEILTVKSDDVVGRVKTYESIVKGSNVSEPGIPEAFKVLLKELQSLALDMKVLTANGDEVDIKDLIEGDLDVDYPVREKDEREEYDLFKPAKDEKPVEEENVMFDDDDNFEFNSSDLFDDADDEIDTTVPTDEDLDFDYEDDVELDDDLDLDGDDDDKI